MLTSLILLLTTLLYLASAVSICDPNDFQFLNSMEEYQGGLSNISLYQNKRDNLPYLRKLIPKEIHSQGNERSKMQSFINEVTALQHLSNTDIAPKILCVSDSPTMTLQEYTAKAGKVYIMMELIRGVPLFELVEYYRDAHTLREVLKQLANRIFQLHSKGVIHLDLKPDNIMIDDTGVRLIDFGGAFSKTLNLTTCVHQSKHFAHPGYRKLRKGTPAMDWYSFGITSYVSRMFQLYPERSYHELFPMDIDLLPDEEEELRELIVVCTEEFQLRDAYATIYETVKRLLLHY